MSISYRSDLYTHEEFMAAYARQMSTALQDSIDNDTIIMGAVSLFWTHSKNIAYLNDAMNFTRAKKGMRLNAVKAFLTAFTGAVFKKGQYVGGGKVKDFPLQADFQGLGSWVDWANENAKEPTYDRKAMVLSLVRAIDRDINKAENKVGGADTATIEALNKAKIALAVVTG